jgi:hypothetical protein
MTDFADVEQFAREHSACGGITPSAAADAGGGFQLSLACACGATFRRAVTMEEAKRPLPLPRTARPAPRPAAPPDAEMEAAIRAAMEADAAAPPPPVERPSPPPDEDLDAVVREALAAESRPAPPPPAPGATSPPSPPAPARLNLDSTIRTALTQHSALKRQTQITAARPAPRTRVVWLILFAVVAFGAAGALYFAGGPDAPELAPVPAPVATAPPAVPLDQRQRAALDEIASSLRQLQAASSTTASLSLYSSRVSFAKSDVDRFIGSTSPGPERTLVRDIMDVHMLAAAAWKARTVDQKDSWEAVGLDPTIEVCPSVKRVVEFATPPPNVSRAQARGEAVASAIPLLWECAAGKLAALDHPPAAQ